MRSSLLGFVLCCVLAHMHVPVTAASRLVRATKCGKNQFQCKNEACIDSKSACDGTQDCTDGSDEDQDSCFSVLAPAVTNFIANDVIKVPIFCPQDKFQCSTGECIDPSLKCNGKNECPDGADERLPECQPDVPTCSGNEFQCKSGQCIPSTNICNGNSDCSDGSDETYSLCGAGSGGNSVPCTYPPLLENGNYKVLGCDSCIPDPGKPLERGSSFLRYTCDDGYELKGENILFCRNGKWNLDPPTCDQRKCPQLTSDSIFAECTSGQSRFTCDWPVLPGTKAIVECKAYYTSTSNPKQSLTCGSNGQWNNVVMKCYPACGKDQSGNYPLVAGGTQVRGGEFPWHVGIYKKEGDLYTNICGGSLISLSYVLSAAHCFWNNGKGAPFPVELFKVIAGKFHKSYTTIDPGQEERAVKDISIPPLYTGSVTYYRDDIAVLTVDTPFPLMEQIRPVCVDWDDFYYIGPGSVGHVAGWGITEKGEPSEDLLSAEFPVIEYRECLKNTKANYQNFFGSDKICAGYRNGTTVCNGDSGGGLSFLHDLNPGLSNKVFFVQGIVSTSGGASKVGSCNVEDYVSFTKVSRYRTFLEKYREY